MRRAGDGMMTTATSDARLCRWVATTATWFNNVSCTCTFGYRPLGAGWCFLLGDIIGKVRPGHWPMVGQGAGRAFRLPWFGGDRGAVPGRWGAIPAATATTGALIRHQPAAASRLALLARKAGQQLHFPQATAMPFMAGAGVVAWLLL